MPLLDGFTPAAGVALYVNTARDTYAALAERGWLGKLEAAGFTVVVDTCTYVTAVMRDFSGAVMTNSGKWAHYAPGNLGIDVAFGVAARIASPPRAAGRVTRLPAMTFAGRTLVAGRGRGPSRPSRRSASGAATIRSPGSSSTARIPRAGGRWPARCWSCPSAAARRRRAAALAEAIRLGTAPAAIVLSSPTRSSSSARMVADALYGRVVSDRGAVAARITLRWRVPDRHGRRRRRRRRCHVPAETGVS